MRARFDLRRTHLSCRASRMLREGPPSWRQRGRPQPIDEGEDFLEQLPRHRTLRQLEGDLPSVAHDLRADLDQLLPQRRQ